MKWAMFIGFFILISVFYYFNKPTGIFFDIRTMKTKIEILEYRIREIQTRLSAIEERNRK